MIYIIVTYVGFITGQKQNTNLDLKLQKYWVLIIEFNYYIKEVEQESKTIE